MKRKKIAALALAALAALCFSGCRDKSGEIYSQMMTESTESGNPASTGEKRELVIETMYEDASDVTGISGLAKEFMSLHPDVEIRVEPALRGSGWAQDEQAFERYLTGFVTRLMSGKGADIVMDAGMLNPKKLVEANLVYDILAWMDQDPDIRREDYYWNLFEPLMYQGQLPVLPVSFSLELVWLNENLAGKAGFQPWDTVDYQDVMALYDQALQQGLLAEDFTLEYRDMKGPYTMFKSEEFPSFVDNATGESTFNTPEFIQYLKETKRIPSARKTTDLITTVCGNVAGMFGKDNQEENHSLMVPAIVAPGDGICDIAAEKENCVGPLVRCAHTGETSYYASRSFLVPKSCKDPELAWEFLKFCIAPVEIPAYFHIYHPEGSVDISRYEFPVAKANLEAYLTLYAKADAYRVEHHGFSGFAPDEMENPLPESFMAGVEKTVSQISLIQGGNGGLNRVIDDILQQYYDTDTLTAEECARQLQERADIFNKE